MESPFDRMTAEYDSWYDSDRGRPLYESELRCVEAILPARLHPMLEIGVGTGRFAMRFPGAFGLDPAPGPLKLAKARGIRCVCGAGESLPFRDGTFKTVLMVVTLCFVREPRAVFHEAARVLAPGGSMIIGLIPADSPWGMLYEKKKKEGNPFYRDAEFHKVSEVEKLARCSGLRIASVASTLLQDPSGPARFEEPVSYYVEGVGFVSLRLEKG
ncbi:MAG: class I SAM-dependent methyltransferase [Deltaproteobacteria bacterium]|nr:class I SAM-dependent methyltransferase [Deltaproteobacteria bacterium]MCL4874243.1 methyltransferase domain-containing protein [bacterium]